MANPRNLISIADLTQEEIFDLMTVTERLKKDRGGKDALRALEGKTLGLFFQKQSTRTRISFQVAMAQLGGQSFFAREDELQVKRGETLKDTARTVSRYLDGIVLRTFTHEYATEFAKYSEIPVINGLTDLYHPCQILGDLYTIIEKKHIKLKEPFDLLKHKIVYIGDGNNIANTFIELAAKIKLNFTIICPRKYSPDRDVVNENVPKAKELGSKLMITENLDEVRGADFIYTDVWVSMGKEDEREERERVFEYFQVNAGLLQRANADTMVMHCLPAVRGKEITDEIIDGKQSIVYDQAENRMHTEKAVLLKLLGGQLK